MTARPPSPVRIAILLGSLVGLTVVGSSAVAVALPDVAADLRLDTAGAAWVMAGFSLTFAVATAVFGRLADLRGLRLPLRLGVGIMAAGSAVAALAPSFAVLVAGRLLQGAGAGAVPVLALGVVAGRFEGPARARALGGLVATVSVVSASGPLLGGVLAQVASWRAVLALPLIALVLGEPVARLAPAGTRQPGRLDAPGALLLAAAVSAVMLLIQVPATGLRGPGLAALVAVGVLACAGLVAHVRRRPGGILPLGVLRDRVVTRSAAAGWSLLAAYLGALLAVPLILDARLGWAPLQIGAALLPAAAAGAVASRVAGRLVGRVEPRRLAAGLTAAAAVGLVVAAGGARWPVVLVTGMALVVVGFAGGQVALLDGLSTAVDEAVRGAALGLFNLVFFAGGAFGAATVGGLGGPLGLPGALAVLAVLPAGGTWAALRLPPGRKGAPMVIEPDEPLFPSS